jgi:hypothetical protein
VYAEDAEGVRLLEVSGSAVGRCDTKDGTFGQIGLHASFPTTTQTAPSGQVWEAHVTQDLDDLLSQDHSCGTHHYANMPSAQEFFFTSGTWTIKARGENCCGGATDATLTIVIP